MHLLGSDLHNQPEGGEHIYIITEEGHNAEVNPNIDSDECDTLFQDTHIPAVK